MNPVVTNDQYDNLESRPERHIRHDVPPAVLDRCRTIEKAKIGLENAVSNTVAQPEIPEPVNEGPARLSEAELANRIARISEPIEQIDGANHEIAGGPYLDVTATRRLISMIHSGGGNIERRQN